jgi:hypothetical protein
VIVVTCGFVFCLASEGYFGWNFKHVMIAMDNSTFSIRIHWLDGPERLFLKIPWMTGFGGGST